MNDETRSPEKTKREKRLGEALRANLKRRKAAARKVAPGKPDKDAPAPSVGHIPGDELPGDERG